MTTSQPSAEQRASWRHRHRTLSRLIATGIVLLISLGLTHLMWSPWLFDVLDVTRPPVEADYVVVLAGGGMRRVEAALDLYDQGFAPRLLLSGSEP